MKSLGRISRDLDDALLCFVIQCLSRGILAHPLAFFNILQHSLFAEWRLDVSAMLRFHGSNWVLLG